MLEIIQNVVIWLGILLAVTGWIAYKIISLPVVTNLLYIKYGGHVAKEVIESLGNVMPDRIHPMNQLVETLDE